MPITPKTDEFIEGYIFGKIEKQLGYKIKIVGDNV